MPKSQFPVPKRVTEDNFGKDELGPLLRYIEDKVKFVLAKTRGIREELMPKWTRIYRGIPVEEHKTWPWPEASNLVIQVSATHCDELLSRVMAMYVNDPLYNVKALGNYDEESIDESGVSLAEELEYFIQDCAYEPDELDLYRVEETGFSSAIRFGTGVFKFPWQYNVEKQGVWLGGGDTEGTVAKYDYKDIVKHDGPRPENVPLSDWSLDPKFPNLNIADFKVHTLHLSYYELLRWKNHPEIYDVAAINKVLQNPDEVPEFRRQIEEQKKVETEEHGHAADQYDIQECWFLYNKGSDVYRMVGYYHVESDTHLGIIYNIYPDNEEPFEDAKLAYDDDTYFGYGFCEMLESYQREVSTTHNWRVDNRHFATTGVGRINKNSKLSSVLQLYPGVLIPADKDELEAMAFGQNAMQYGTEDEQLTLALAKERSGVDPATGGSGGGTVNAKKGIYSAQGTAMSLQASNNRNNLRMSDMRSCHVRMGRKILKMYAYYGLGDKIRKYGDRAGVIRKALDEYKAKKLGLIIKPATASQNREMEKQNEILLSATLERLYQTDLQLVQALTTPGQNEQMVDLITKQLRAKNALMKSLLRSFGREDYNRLLAIPEILKQNRQKNIGAANGQQRSNGNGGSPQNFNPQQGQIEGMVPGGIGTSGGEVPLQ